MQADKRPLFWRVDLFRAKAEEAGRAARIADDVEQRKGWQEIASGWSHLAAQTELLVVNNTGAAVCEPDDNGSRVPF
jgi:hypothetical protein